MSTTQELKEEFLALLAEEREEQAYQAFMEAHTQFIPREFVQNHGVHFSLAMRKVPFGTDFVGDFFFLSKSSDDWNAVFIEIEKPQLPFFKKGTNDLHPRFVHALEQVNHWRAWLSVEGNQKSFLNGTIGAIRLPPVMAMNPTFNKYVLVYGRRGEYADNEHRRALIRGYERDDFKIISFDSLAEDIAHKNPLYLGVRHNSHVRLLSDELVDENIFSWVDPTQISVNGALHAAILKKAPSNSLRWNGKDGYIEALSYVAPLLRRH